MGFVSRLRGYLTWRRLFLLVVVVTVPLMIVWIQRSLVFIGKYYPGQVVEAPEDAETWWLDTDQGRVESWFLPGDGVTDSAPGPLVVHAHGNGERISDWPDALAPYRRLGISLLLVEYRGYGRSAGSPSEAHLHADFTQQIERALADPRVDASRLVYHGRSLGGGVIGTLLNTQPPRAVILESTFSSLTAVARQSYYAPSFLIVDKFDTAAALADYDGALLILHGDSDRVVPEAHGRTLRDTARPANAPPPVWVQMQCGHNNMPRQESFWGPVRALLRDAGVLGGE